VNRRAQQFSGLCAPLAALLCCGLARAGESFWFPTGASEGSAEHDWIYAFVFYICAFFFALICGLVCYNVLRFRQRRGYEKLETPDHSRALEITWTVIPVILVMAMFFLGYTSYLNMRVPPENALEIQVTGQKWRWSFEYQNGYVDAGSESGPPELHVPPNMPITVALHSQDVIHGFFIPAFRLKMDAVPGRIIKIWFTATEPGEYPIFCSQYCGTQHSMMRALCVVHQDQASFAEWLAKANAQLSGTLTPAERGRHIYAGKGGCIQCHSLDGSIITGPSFKDLFGKKERLGDGSEVQVDENYVHFMVLHPGVKVVAGFPNVMPSFLGRLSDKEISDLTEFMKAHSKFYKGPKPPEKKENK
jgi:cytochrome c oxidase subunit 2